MQVKVYKKACSEKCYSLMNLQIYTNIHEGQMFRRYLARDVNLQGTFLMIRAFSSIVTTAAAIARAFLTRVG
jgi:hypothetical protein